MLTKTANAVIGAFTGALSSAQLTPEELNAIAAQHGLPADRKKIVARNVGRGAVGGALGGFAGGLAGLITRKPRMIPMLSMGGGMMGGGMATTKYSRTAAADLRLQQLEKQMKNIKA